MSTRIFALMLFVFSKIGAQSCCCGNVGSLTSDGTGLINQQGFLISLSEDFRQFGDMKMSAMHHPMAMNSDVLKQSSLSSLSIKEMFKNHNWLQINAAYLKAIGSSSITSAPTDMVLLAGRYFEITKRDYVNIGIGAKLPTAAITNDASNNAIAVFGTGSIDPILQTMYLRTNKNILFRTDGFMRYAAQNRDNKTFGSYFSLSTIAAYKFKNESVCSDTTIQNVVPQFILSAGITYELFSRMKVSKLTLSNTGGSVVFGKLEASIQLKKNYFSVAVLQPVSQAWYGMQPNMKARIKVSLTIKIF